MTFAHRLTTNDCYYKLDTEHTQTGHWAHSDDDLVFFQEFGTRTKEATDGPLSYHKLCQRISVTVQKFNCSAIVNTWERIMGVSKEKKRADICDVV
jgi:hypothetical protein